MLKGQAKVFGALSKDEESLKDLVVGLNDTISGFARQEDNLKAAIPELRDVFREGRPALASLDRAFPEIRGFARDATPGARSTSPTLDCQIPFTRQLRQLVAEDELGGLTRQLRGAVPNLARLNTRSPRTFAQNRALASCQNQRAGAVREEADPRSRLRLPHQRAVVRGVLAARSWASPARAAWPTPTRPYFRTLAAGRAHHHACPRARPASSSSASWTSRSPACAPRGPSKRPGFRPDMPCENQEVPDLNAVGGPPGPDGHALAHAAAAARQPRARAGAPRAVPPLREYADRTRKGLPALDPFVWWGQGETHAAQAHGPDPRRAGPPRERKGGE